MADNRIRVFSEVVAIDAWHQPIQVSDYSASVHVDVTFKQGRVGGNDDRFPFTFRLSLKKATLLVTVESPLEVDRKSVARNVPEAQVEYSRIKLARESAVARLAAGARLTPSHVSAHLNAAAELNGEHSDQVEKKLSLSTPPTMVTYEPVDRSNYRWTLSPVLEDELSGQPWDPVSNPRLRMGSSKTLGRIEPIIKAEIFCALEDLEISDIKPKEKPTISAKIHDFVFGDENKAVAIQHLKLLLRDADLDPGSLDNRFSDVLLASVIALEDRNA
ncbi:hypothetical protein [Sphingobium sp. LMC3-1-1.1]|uniref:hypothetical protein n=1 Tax=unclassified Sphingobium TaxID=2611147 RepID=UPI00341BE0CE